MNNLHYDFDNTGYKIHLPVVPDVNDPLTSRIIDYLDTKYGIKTTSKLGSQYFKIGSGGDLKGGGGLTLYGRTGALPEMQELAQEIEQKFGKELADNVKKYNITFEDPLKLSNSVSARFAIYGHERLRTNNFGQLYYAEPLMVYNNRHNPSGAINVKGFIDINGKYQYYGKAGIKGLSEIDRKFLFGDSTLYAIDNFGELFTGKAENGKVPQFIMDGLPKEYLQHYNLSEKDIIARINKGTRQIVANMLEDVVKNPKSKILAGNPPWLATLDTKVIDEAKQLLAQYEPQTVQKLEQMLPQLEQKCPALAVLKQTTPFSQMNITPVNPVGTQNPVNPTPKPQPTPKPNTNVGGNPTKIGWFEKLGPKGKVGLAVAGTALVAGAIYTLAHHNIPKKGEVKTVGTENQLNQQTQSARAYQYPCNTDFHSYCHNPYYTIK